MSKDIISEINGLSTVDMTIYEAITEIRGPKGDNVVLTIVREGESSSLEINIVRDEIHINSVEWEMKDGNIAVIGVSHFGTELDTEFQEAVSEILLEEPTAIIFDIRNNPGGLLDKCIELATEFMDRELIVQIKGKQIGNDRDYISGKNGAFKDIPLIVLTNGATASAAEIFAGAVQDHNRGIVLGTKSYGKGLVQEVIDLNKGGSLKVTVAEWLTPNGNFINEEGISPDVEMEINEDDFAADIDTQINAALSILKNEGEYKKLLQAQIEAQAEKAEKDTQ
jgi:carboxyl-terminal processing protease